MKMIFLKTNALEEHVCFFVILAFCKKVQLEPKLNRNTQFSKFLETDRFIFFGNRISSKTEKSN